MEEDLEKDLKNLMYTIEMHHISSEPIQNLIARYKELQEDIGKEYHLGFAQGSYEKDEDWKFKLREKITEIDKQGDTPHVRYMSYRTKKDL